MSEDSSDATGKSYLVVIQCDQATHEVCPGFLCEHAFARRTGGFARYPAEQALRYLPVSCGGCSGRAVLRKLMNLKKNLKKREGIDPSAIIVHLSSCITRSNHHGPRCPHIDSIKRQVAAAGLDAVEDSRISDSSEKKRREGVYRA